MKKCASCKRKFKPSSRHGLCPICRRTASKKPCVCGGTKNHEYKFCTKWADRSGKNNGRWSGGKTYHKAGYVMVYISSGKYKFEHILTMEKHLGRLLLEGENVHHKNGIKDDNHIKNLELWIRPQPSGIRVKDALKWARELLRHYA